MRISVVIPVYNVEPYLHTCLDSVLNQTSSDWDCVCVDDGSTDGSGCILDEYAARDSRFTVIHQPNGGVSSARNRGMDVATGGLVAFLDADDTFDRRAFEIVSDVHERTGAEVIRYGCNLVSDHAEDVVLSGRPGSVEIKVDGGQESPLRQCATGGSSVISARLAGLVSWPALSHCEDPLFVLRCLKAARKAVRIEGNLFNYLQRRDSAVHAATLPIVAATCRYLVMAYDECAALPGFFRSRTDTCAHLASFLRGPLANCGRDVAPADRVAAEAAVRTASNLLVSRDPAFAPFAVREKFDFTFTLGSSCTATDVLRQAGLQFGTFPLDWVGRLGVAARTDLIVGGFKDFLRADRLKLECTADDGCHLRYVDAERGTAFFHDFPVGKPLAESFPVVRAKYDRRIARFLRYLQDARSVLVVWIGDFRDGRDGISSSDAEFSACLDRLEKRFPGTHFALLVFDQAEAGAAPQERAVTDGRIRRMAVDYRDWEQGPESWAIRTDRLLPHLAHFIVRDYRTAEEKRAYRRAQRRAKYARLHVKSWWEALLVGFQYRLFRHLRKRLGRRGIHLGAHA